MPRRLAFLLILLLLTAGTVLANGGVTFQGLPVVRMAVNGSLVQSDPPPVMVGDRVFVPLRLVSEAIGASVAWDDQSRTATIDTAGITAPLKSRLSDAQAELSAARAKLAQAQSDLTTATSELDAAKTELAKTKAALRQRMGSAPFTLSAETYAAAIQSAPLAGPEAAATLGKGTDCVPSCTSWDRTIDAGMLVYGKPYLAFGLNDLPAEMLTAPYTMVMLSLKTSSTPPFTVDLSDVTLSVDGQAPVKAAYISDPRVALKTYNTHWVTLVFPVAPGESATLSFTSPVRVMSLTAVTPQLPERFAGYARGPGMKPELEVLAREAAAHLEKLRGSLPYVDAPAGFPKSLSPFAHLVTDDWIRENIGPTSPLLDQRYSYRIVTFSNTSKLLAEVTPAAFAMQAAGKRVEPVGFIPLNPLYVFENYNGLFLYPGHSVEVLVVYPRL